MNYETIITTICAAVAASLLINIFRVVYWRDRADRAEAVTRYEQRRYIGALDRATELEDSRDHAWNLIDAALIRAHCAEAALARVEEEIAKTVVSK